MVGPKYLGDILGPSSLLPAELLLQCFEECFVHGFHLPICRWVNRSGIIILNLTFGAPFTKWSAVKLLSVVNYKGMWDAESAYDRASKKFYHVVDGDSSECLSFGTLGEIVYSDKKEFPLSLSLSRWHGSDYVNTPFREWPRRSDRTKFFGGGPSLPEQTFDTCRIIESA
jgi:hypothetical protein